MSHILLSLETSGTRCGVALLQGEGSGASIMFDHQDGTQQHAERLLPMVTGLLAQAGLTQSDISAVAFGQGPGGFTGLRVACAVAQGMAMALGISVVPIGSLDAIAHEVARRDHPVVVAVAMDARMGEAYAALFLLEPGHAPVPGQLRADAAAPIVIQPPVLLAGADLAAWLREAERHAQAPLAELKGGMNLCSWVLAGDGWAVHAGAQAPVDPWEIDPIDRPTAQAVARLGAQAFIEGKAIDAAQAQPLYVRDKVAFTTAERAGGLGGNPKASSRVGAGGEP